MKYISIFSGIEAATVAWEPLGWEPVCFAELDEFPSAVLEQRYPHVPNVGDVTKADWRKIAKQHGKPDLVVGGSPCQSFSVAGARTGLDGASGLMWEYVRAVRELKPDWVLWENVPGALSSSHGEDFRCLLESLDALGYGLAWRVLDAQFFGLAQRRERLFLVGRLGGEPPVEVLFEPEGLRWGPESSREKRKELASGAGRGAACAGFKYSAGSSAQSIGYQEESSNTITADWHAPAVIPFAVNQQRQVRIQGDGTLTGAIPASQSATQFNGVVQEIARPVGAQASMTPWGIQSERISPADCAAPTIGCCHDGGGNHGHNVLVEAASGNAVVRRLTPRECERLQGFPDDWTLVPYRGKPASECPDGPRYKAIGNSMAVPVMRWIGERMAAVEEAEDGD